MWCGQPSHWRVVRELQFVLADVPHLPRQPEGRGYFPGPSTLQPAPLALATLARGRRPPREADRW